MVVSSRIAWAMLSLGIAVRLWNPKLRAVLSLCFSASLAFSSILAFLISRRTSPTCCGWIPPPASLIKKLALASSRALHMLMIGCHVK